MVESGSDFEHNQLAASSGIAFAVSQLQVEFVAPAFIDDLLEVVTELETPRGAVMNFRQMISRDGVDAGERRRRCRRD